MSDPTLLVLSSLAEGDKHGYKIMQDVEAFAHVTLGPGTLYGAITRLEERGWIEPVGPKDRRQTYTITPAGRAHLQGELAALQQVVKTGLARLLMRSTGRDRRRGVLDAGLHDHGDADARRPGRRILV